ncbi:hypothetical protein C8F01DRAFT_1168848 [Mycena amicta]|nr:hypothetical protein C8F01DRAFT_1168848 [Mycena amicta]
MPGRPSSSQSRFHEEDGVRGGSRQFTAHLPALDYPPDSPTTSLCIREANLRPTPRLQLFSHTIRILRSPSTPLPTHNPSDHPYCCRKRASVPSTAQVATRATGYRYVHSSSPAQPSNRHPSASPNRSSFTGRLTHSGVSSNHSAKLLTFSHSVRNQSSHTKPHCLASSVRTPRSPTDTSLLQTVTSGATNCRRPTSTPPTLHPSRYRCLSRSYSRLTIRTIIFGLVHRFAYFEVAIGRSNQTLSERYESRETDTWPRVTYAHRRVSYTRRRFEYYISPAT